MTNAKLIELIAEGLDCPDFGEAGRVLAALREHGYVVVPREPTSEMKGAGHKALEQHTGRMEHLPVMADIYAAMIAAAAPQTGEGT